MISFERRHHLIGFTPEKGLPTWAEWLTLPGEALRERTNTNKISALREQAVGHSKVFNTQWALTIGMWGISHLPEILSGLPVPVSKNNAGAFKHAWKLRTRHKQEEAKSPYSMCLLVQNKIRSGVGEWNVDIDWRRIAESSGILPIEAVLYDMAFQCMVLSSGMPPSALMKLSHNKFRELWEDTGVSVRAETIVPAGGKLPFISDKLLCA